MLVDRHSCFSTMQSPMHGLVVKPMQLAMKQTTMVLEQLKAAYPDRTFEIVSLKTLGDKILDVSLSKVSVCTWLGAIRYSIDRLATRVSLQRSWRIF